MRRKTSNRFNRPHPVDITVGTRLALRRRMLGFSQEQLAKASDLPQRMIEKYETGNVSISAGRLYRFARLLSTEISYFFADLGTRGESIEQANRE